MKFFLSCREASRLQSESLDRPLPFLRGLGLRLHLLVCSWCRRYGKQLAFLRSAARRCDEHRAEAPAQKLSPEARDRIKRALQSHKD